jgi:TfoX/Sxy family transcriptional regulator of competence genes
MFGEYMVYVNEKLILLVCDNTVFVKMLDCIGEKRDGAERGVPYPGAREHYILDIDDAAFSKEVIALLEPVVPVPKPRAKKRK